MVTLDDITRWIKSDMEVAAHLTSWSWIFEKKEGVLTVHIPRFFTSSHIPQIFKIEITEVNKFVLDLTSIHEELHPLESFGEHMTRNEFACDVLSGALMDSDGFGYYATGKKESRISARPSDFKKGEIDLRFSHVTWYNK